MALAGNEVIDCVLPAGQITTGQIAALNNDAMTTLAAGRVLRYVYNVTNTTWYNI